jgi:hypothetical protein
MPTCSSENAFVLALTRLSALELAALFHAHLPLIVAHMAEMRSAEAKVTSLPFATVTAFPA